MPVIPHTVYGKTYDIFGNILTGVSVTLTHATITPVLSATSDGNGDYNLSLGNLDSQWSVGQAITLVGTKSAEGTKTVITTISTGGSQVVNITLDETSDFAYLTQVQNRVNMNTVFMSHYDGLKVTRLRPFPVESKNALEGYEAADEDFSADPEYRGYVNRFGNWYIRQNNRANGTYKFAKGTSGYETNWANRTTLTYDYFHNAY